MSEEKSASAYGYTGEFWPTFDKIYTKTTATATLLK